MLNQDYFGLHCEAQISTTGNSSFGANQMTYGGNDSGNSWWTYTRKFASGTVWYYHDGWEDFSGSHIYDNNGGANYTVTISPLNAPSGQTAVAVSSSQINLAWTQGVSGNAKNTTILRSAGSPPNTDPTQGTSYTVGNTIGNATVILANAVGTSLNDTGLTSGTTYYYKFYANNFNYYSASASATATAAVVDEYWRTDGTTGGTWTSTYWNIGSATSTGGTGWNSGNNAVFTADSTLTFATATVGNVTVAATKNVTVTAGGTLTLASPSTFDIGSGATLAWQSQTVTANSASGITKNGAGTLNLGALTFSTSMTGGFTLNAGTVIVSGTKAFGSGAMTVNGGILQSSGGNTFTPTSLTIAGDFAFAGTGNDIWNQPVSLGASTRTITNSTTSTATRTLAGAITGSAAAGLTFTGSGGSGGIVLGGTNTYTGNTTINSGIVALGANGSINYSPLIRIAAGATFDVSAINSFALSSSTALSASGTGTTVGTSAATIKGASGGTISLGSQAIALTWGGSTSGSDSTHPALYVSQGTLSLNGNAFTINSSSPLAIGTYTIIQQASGNITSSGTFSVSGTAIGSGKTGSISVTGGSVNLVIKGNAAFSNIAASQSINYGATAIVLSGKLSAAGPTYPANGETITATINGNAQTTTVNDATGDFSFSYNPSTIPYSATTYTITYSYTGNSSLTSASDATTTLTVNKRSLSITANSDTKTYGQTKTYGAGQTSFSSSGLQNSETIDSVTIAASGGTAATDGTNSYSLTPSSATGGTFNAANYSITYNIGTLTVNPLPVSLTGSRTYDGTTNAAAGVLSIANIVNSDNVNVASGTAGLASANVGSEAITSIGTLALGGTRATNYTVVGASGSVTITARPVNLSGTRAYDGTTNAAAAILSVANAVGADTVNVASGTAGLADKNVGTQSITSFGTLSLGNNSAGNYTLSGATGSVVITQAVTSVSASSSENPSGYKDSISFTASLPSGATGTVVFKTNAVALSTNNLSTGTATSASTVALSRGTNVVTVEYAGDSNYLGSTNNLSGGQVVTNHPPAAATMLVQRSAGLTLKIALADIVTNWSDVDDDSVALASLNLVTTNNVNITTNSTWILYTNSPNVDDQISYTIADGQGGTNTGLINIAIVNTVTGTNSISSIVNNGTSVSLVAYGIPDLTYVTQRSTNLADWVSIATNVAATNGAIFVTDNFTDLPSPPDSAYYRLSWTP